MTASDLSELLSAYLDGEVSAEERVRIERALEQQPALREQLEEFADISGAIRGLPRLAAPESLAPAILARLQNLRTEDADGPSFAPHAAEAASTADIAAPPIAAVSAPSRPRPAFDISNARGRRRMLLRAGAGVAAALLLAVWVLAPLGPARRGEEPNLASDANRAPQPGLAPRAPAGSAPAIHATEEELTTKAFARDDAATLEDSAAGSRAADEFRSMHGSAEGVAPRGQGRGATETDGADRWSIAGGADRAPAADEKRNRIDGAATTSQLQSLEAALARRHAAITEGDVLGIVDGNAPETRVLEYTVVDKNVSEAAGVVRTLLSRNGIEPVAVETPLSAAGDAGAEPPFFVYYVEGDAAQLDQAVVELARTPGLQNSGDFIGTLQSPLGPRSPEFFPSALDDLQKATTSRRAATVEGAAAPEAADPLSAVAQPAPAPSAEAPAALAETEMDLPETPSESVDSPLAAEPPQPPPGPAPGAGPGLVSDALPYFHDADRPPPPPAAVEYLDDFEGHAKMKDLLNPPFASADQEAGESSVKNAPDAGGAHSKDMRADDDSGAALQQRRSAGNGYQVVLPQPMATRLRSRHMSNRSYGGQSSAYQSLNPPQQQPQQQPRRESAARQGALESDPAPMTQRLMLILQANSEPLVASPADDAGESPPEAVGSVNLGEELPAAAASDLPAAEASPAPAPAEAN